MVTVASKIKADVELVGSKIKSVILKSVGVADEVAAKVDAAAPEIEELVAFAAPQASLVVKAALTLLDGAVKADDAVGSATTANGLVVELDQDALAALRAVAPLWKSFVSAFGAKAAATVANAATPAPGK